MKSIARLAAVAAFAAASLPSGASAQSPAAGLTGDPLGIAAVELLDLAFNQKKVREAFERYVREDYIQHNPTVATGREAAIIGLGALLEQVPGWRYDFKRVLVDGDFVVVHAHITISPGDRGQAVVDILRAENGVFIEHWDVIQPVPETPANENTMF